MSQDCFVFPHSLTVFFPTYNGAGSLPALLECTFAILRWHVTEYEVIVVNDGSEDETSEVLAALVEKYGPDLKVVTHRANRGYGATIRSGLKAASKEFVLYTDGDGQYDPREMIGLLEAVGPDVELVNGYKMRHEDPWHRVVAGAIYNHLARILFGIRIRDIDCGFRLVRKSFIDRANLTFTSRALWVELVRKIERMKRRVVEVPVNHYPRLHGHTETLRLKALAAAAVQMWLLYRRLVILPAITSPSDRLPARSKPWSD